MNLKEQFKAETGKDATTWESSVNKVATRDYTEWLESKALSPPIVTDSFVLHEMVKTMKALIKELKLANSRLGWIDSTNVLNAECMVTQIVAK